jgi:coenzyme F420-reducing hydrogenase gamma subunit
MIHSDLCINKKRVDRASKLMKYYSEITGCPQDEDDVVDMLADILHLAEFLNLDVDGCFRRAWNHYDAEKDHFDEECEEE